MEGFCFAKVFYVDYYVENIIGCIIKIIAAFLGFAVSCCKGLLPPFPLPQKTTGFIFLFVSPYY